MSLHRAAGMAAAMLALAVPSAAFAAAPTYVALDSYSAANAAFVGPAMSADVVPSGKRVVADVTGTISYYAKDQYSPSSSSWPKQCGTTSGNTMYKSAAKAQGPAGIDAEFVYARPGTTAICNKIPGKWTNFQISSTGGFDWIHPRPVGVALTAPLASHSYGYPVVGSGVKLQFRLKDLPGSRDNYGELHITVRNAVKADCAGSGVAFGYASDAACEAALPAK